MFVRYAHKRMRDAQARAEGRRKGSERRGRKGTEEGEARGAKERRELQREEGGEQKEGGFEQRRRESNKRFKFPNLKYQQSVPALALYDHSILAILIYGTRYFYWYQIQVF